MDKVRLAAFAVLAAMLVACAGPTPPPVTIDAMRAMGEVRKDAGATIYFFVLEKNWE